MTVTDLVAALTRRATLHPDEDTIVHMTLPDGSVIVGDITGFTDIGPGDGFVLIATGSSMP